MWRLAIALVIVAASGCADKVTKPETGPEVGTYILKSLNGVDVPTTIAEGSIEIEVLSGTLTLGAGSTVQTRTTFRTSPGAAPMTVQVSGTYTLEGNALSFLFSHGGFTTATVIGVNRLDMLNEGVVWSFLR